MAMTTTVDALAEPARSDLLTKTKTTPASGRGFSLQQLS